MNQKAHSWRWLLILVIWGGLTGCGLSSPTPITERQTTPPTASPSLTVPLTGSASPPAPSPTTLTSPTSTRPPASRPTATHTPTAISPTATATPAPTVTVTPVPASPTRPAVSPTPMIPTPALTTYVRQLVVVPTSPEMLIALLDDGRLLRSSDGGRHWLLLYTGQKETQPRAVGVDYNPPHPLYLLTRQGLYRSPDYGDNFEFINGITGTAITVSYENAAHLWLGGSNEQLIMKSGDGGQTWLPARIGISGYQVVSPIFINPHDGNMLLVITQGKRGGAALYRGTRDGTWTKLPSPPWLVPTGLTPIGLAWDNEQRILYTGDIDGKLYHNLNVEALDQTTVTWEVSYDFGRQKFPFALAIGAGSELYITLYDKTTYSGPLLRGTRQDTDWSWQEISLPNRF